MESTKHIGMEHVEMFYTGAEAGAYARLKVKDNAVVGSKGGGVLDEKRGGAGEIMLSVAAGLSNYESNRTWGVCLHEAAHAVCALVVLRSESGKLGARTFEGRGGIAFHSPGRTSREKAMLALTGDAAEAHAWRLWPPRPDGQPAFASPPADGNAGLRDSDRASIWQKLAEDTREEFSMPELCEEAGELVRQNWRPIVAIAAELYRRGSIDDQTIREIFAKVATRLPE